MHVYNLLALVWVRVVLAKYLQVNSNRNVFGDFSLGKGFDSRRFEVTNAHVFLEDAVSFDFVPLISSSMNCAVIQKASDVHSKLGMEGRVSLEYLFFSGEGFFTYDEENEAMRKRVYLKCIIDRSLFTISINPPNLKNEDACNFSELPHTILSDQPEVRETATSGEACAMLCCVESWCKSADFSSRSGDCLLYDQSAAVIGLETSEEFTHYDMTQAFQGLNPYAQKLGNQADVNQAKEDLSKEFGLEYVNSITYGRRYEVEVGMTYSRESEFEKVAAKIKGEAHLGMFKVSAEFKFESESSSSESSLEMNIASSTLGFLEAQPLRFPTDSDSTANAGANLMEMIEANMNAMIKADDQTLEGQSGLKKRQIVPLLRGAYPIHFTTASSEPWFPVLSLDENDMEQIAKHLRQAYDINNNLETMLADIEDRSKELYSNFDLLSGRTELSIDFLQTKYDLTTEIQTVLSYVKDYTSQSAEEILADDILAWAFEDPRVDGLNFLTVDLLTTKIENLMGLGDLEMNDANVIGDRCIFHGIQANISGIIKKFAGTVQFADFEVRHVIFDQSQQVVSLGYIRDISTQDELVYVRSDCSVVREGSEIWYRGGRYEVTRIGNEEYVKGGRVEKSLLKNVRVYIRPQDADLDSQFLLTIDELQDPTFGLRGAENSLSFTVDDQSRLMFRDGYVCDTGFGMHEARMLCTLMGYNRVDSFRTNVELPTSNAYGLPRTTMNHLSCDSHHTNTQSVGDFLTSDLCTYDLEDIACSAEHGIELMCEYEPESDSEELCKVDLWAGSEMETETHECTTTSTGFGLYHIAEECNGRQEYDGIRSMEVSGCCVALLDENDHVMCALGGGSLTREDFSGQCGESKAVKYETVRMGGSFFLGGTVSGNGAGGNLILVHHANMETLEVNGNGVFAFQEQFECGHHYDVQVSSQPSNRLCSVQRGNGFIVDENVQDISIECVTLAPTSLPSPRPTVVTLVTSLPSPQPIIQVHAGALLFSERQELQNWGVPSDFGWDLCYRSSEHGWSTSTAQSRCTGNRAVVIATLDNGKRIGGYSEIGIPSSGSWYNGYDSFLFSLTNMHKHELISGQSHYSFYRSTSYLVWGGGNDWVLYLDESSLGSGYCELGYTYACRVGSLHSTECRNDFCGSYTDWTPIYVEIFN